MRATTIFRLLLPIVVLAVVGCAPLPISGPVVRDMPACGVSVRFSGYAVQIPADVLRAAITKQFGNYAKWDITGWSFSKYRLEEFAGCACRDFPFTAAEFEKASLATPAYAIAGIGQAFETEGVESTEAKMRMKSVLLKHAPSCMLMQGVVSPEPNNAAAAFFPSLALIPNAALSSPAQPPGGSVAERLRQLDQLLKDRLISQDEYNKRRNVVLESL